MVRSKNMGHNNFVKAISGAALSFAGGFLFSGTNIGGVASFADIALAGSLSLPFAAAVFMGAAARCVVTDSVGRCIVKLAAIMVILSAKLLSERFSRPTESGIITAAAVLISGAAVSALIGEMPKKLLFYGIYGLIAGFTARAGAELLESFREKRVVDLSGGSGLAYAVVCVIYSAALFSMKLTWGDAGFAVSAALTLAAAHFYGSKGGLICGGLAVGGAFFASSDAAMRAAVLPVAGLLTGALKRSRIITSAVIFSLTCITLRGLTGGYFDSISAFSLLCGMAVFVVGAPHFSDKLISVGDHPHPADTGNIRLNFLSDAIEAVRVDAGKISAALSADVSKRRDISGAKAVCDRCYRRGMCGRADMDAAGELIPVLPEDCIRKSEIAAELESSIRDRAAENVLRLRASEERELLNEHMKMMGDLVRELGSRTEMRSSGGVVSRIADTLENHGILPENITAEYNPSNRLIVGIYFGAGHIADNTSRICDLVSDELGVRFSVGTTVSSAKETRISLFEQPEFEIEVCTASSSADSSGVSGDSSAVFTDSIGVSYVVISDGMGSGKTAAVDSHIVIGMFRRLICSGMEIGSAVRMVNSVMATKSRNESFATLDVIAFDPDKCRITSVKSGAAATVIRSGNDVIKVFAPTFPVGITKQAELSVSEYDLSDGDAIIMTSDGIGDKACMFIKERLLGDSDIRETVREIALRSKVFSTSEHPDDVTVIGIKVRYSQGSGNF